MVYCTTPRSPIDNALTNEQILAALSDFGYTAERIQQGKALYTTALAAQTTQQMEAGEQKSATAEAGGQPRRGQHHLHALCQSSSGRL